MTTATFCIEEDAAAYRYRLRRNGVVVLQGPRRATRADALHDIHQLRHLVSDADVEPAAFDEMLELIG